jgi:hypothetical protein
MVQPGAIQSVIQRDEAALYYFNYIDKVPTGDIVDILGQQLEDFSNFLNTISEEKSMYRYEPGKWTIREVLSHSHHPERLFLSRAFWFARGFDSPLPSFNQEVAIAAAAANDHDWTSHVEEFRTIRQSTLSFFRHLPSDAWHRRGIASDAPFTVRALAYILAGHIIHHRQIVESRYLK